MQEDNLVGIADDQAVQVEIGFKTHHFLQHQCIVLLLGYDGLGRDPH